MIVPSLMLTGSLFRDVKPYKRLLHYVIKVKHPFPGKPALPVAEYITSNHCKDSLIFFIFHVNKYVLQCLRTHHQFQRSLYSILV